MMFAVSTLKHYLGPLEKPPCSHRQAGSGPALPDHPPLNRNCTYSVVLVMGPSQIGREGFPILYIPILHISPAYLSQREGLVLLT